MKILIICTGNSCRSQMAEGFLRSKLSKEHQIFSAGTKPETEVNPYAVKVMQEINIDISKQTPENVDKYVEQNFDYVITVCDNAKENCPIFTGKVSKQLHIGFEDPAEATGTEKEILNKYIEIRDEIIMELGKVLF